MAPSPLGKAEPGDQQGHPSEGADPVDLLPRLHPAKTETAPRADAARPRGHNDRPGSDELPAGGQGGIDIDRLEITAEGVTAGHGTAEHPLFPELMNSAAKFKRQRRAVAHDVSDTAFGPVIFQHRSGGGNHAVQLADQDRHPRQAAEAGQLGPVSRSALLAAEHPQLPGSVAELHDMAAAAKGGQRPAEIKLDKMAPPAAQSEKMSGCIEQEQIACPHRAGQPVIIQRSLLAALDEHLQFTDGAAPLKKSTGKADFSTDHCPPTTFMLIFAPLSGNSLPRRPSFRLLGTK